MLCMSSFKNFKLDCSCSWAKWGNKFRNPFRFISLMPVSLTRRQKIQSFSGTCLSFRYLSKKDRTNQNQQPTNCDTRLYCSTLKKKRSPKHKNALLYCCQEATLHTLSNLLCCGWHFCGLWTKSTGDGWSSGWYWGDKEEERDKKDTEKNRLTSLHLIGSSCNHKERWQMKKRKARQEREDSKQTSKDRERTAPQRLAVRDDQHIAKADEHVATDQK